MRGFIPLSRVTPRPRDTFDSGYSFRTISWMAPAIFRPTSYWAKAIGRGSLDIPFEEQ